MPDRLPPARTPREPLPLWMRIGRVVLVLGILVAAVTFRITQDSHMYRDVVPDGINLRMSRATLQASALRNGVQFLAMWNSYSPRRWVEVHLSRRNHIGRNGNYPPAAVLAFCGLNAACNPREFNGGDYIVSPFLAVDLPYWLLIAASALLMIWWSAPLVLLETRSLCRKPSWASWGVMALVAAGFVVLNWWAQIEPYSSEQSVWTLMTAPGTYNDGVLYLAYGWPSTCLTRIWDHGIPAPNGFQGHDTLGWRPVQLAENALVALTVMLLSGICAEWSRRRLCGIR